MRISTIIIGAGLALAPAMAAAAPLTVVEVGAPAVNCVFNANCTVAVSDTVGPIQAANFSGTARVQSRTYAAAAGTPAAGKTAYEYRVDLLQASGNAECLVGLVLDFGPVAKLPYKNNVPADVFVTTTGGIGSVGIKSAEQDGSVITFTFSKYLCVGNAPGAGVSTFFFGLAAATAPKAAAAHLFGFGNPPFIEVAARVPTH